MRTLGAIFSALLTLAPAGALAQGQDSTPAERNILVISELLPGIYDNANQNYFDERLGVREEARHMRIHTLVEHIDRPNFGDNVYWLQSEVVGGGDSFFAYILVLEVDNDRGGVAMKFYDLDRSTRSTLRDAHLDPEKLATLTPETTTYRDGCDLIWKREAGQFAGNTDAAQCEIEYDGNTVNVDFMMMLTPQDLWSLELYFDKDETLVSGNPDRIPYQLTRARNFDCYADIPGVGGGRDEPYDRYKIDGVHDMGGLKWFEAKVGREFGVTLRNVDWPMNNEVGAFTRNSLVLYILERTEDGVEEVTYGFTEPGAERLGINMKWMLVNCYMISNRDVTPFFGREPGR